LAPHLCFPVDARDFFRDAERDGLVEAGRAFGISASQFGENLWNNQLVHVSRHSGRLLRSLTATRRLARELGVALAEVTGSGARGRIVKDDVKAFVKRRLSGPAAAPAGSGIPAVPKVDFARFGQIESVPMSRIRRAGAANLHRSWLNVVHVTQHDEADVTELEAFRRSLKDEAERRGIKLSPLPFVVKACVHALKEFATFNASLDVEASAFVLKRYYNVGIAVDTPNGLVVPVVKAADTLGIWELAAEIARLSELAREGKLGMADGQGGTFTVSSLGAIGGTGFTPIVNAPEVAILGVSRLAMRPVWVGDAFVPRAMLPLSLSYDHRAINGAEAGRFVTHLAALLGDIRRLAL
jgi:pyruvate dehydrogenase E2 component (dihydrolipoamide acetyltransferase)